VSEQPCWRTRPTDALSDPRNHWPVLCERRRIPHSSLDPRDLSGSKVSTTRPPPPRHSTLYIQCRSPAVSHLYAVAVRQCQTALAPFIYHSVMIGRMCRQGTDITVHQFQLNSVFAHATHSTARLLLSQRVCPSVCLAVTRLYCV